MSGCDVHTHDSSTTQGRAGDGPGLPCLGVFLPWGDRTGVTLELVLRSLIGSGLSHLSSCSLLGSALKSKALGSALGIQNLFSSRLGTSFLFPNAQARLGTPRT